MNQQTTRPHTASDFLEKASETLGERGKQYDPNGKQERSMTAICAAFNAIYPASQLTVHMGWQFMSLVKMVRGATKPHADSALDQVAYAALAAEEVANQLHSQEPAVQPAEEPQPANSTHEPSYKSLQISNRALAEELGKCQHWAGGQSQEIKHLEAKFMGERKANTAMHDEVIRLLGKLQDTHNEVESLEQELETVRGECISRGAQLAEARAKVEAMSNRELGSLACLKAVIQTAAYIPGYAHEKIQDVVVNCGYGYLYQPSEVNLKGEPEPACAHNTDEAADNAALMEAYSKERDANPRPLHDTRVPPPKPYVDPYDSYVAAQPKPLPRTVGSADPARAGLDYPQGKPL